jgi:hypothetical protein
VTIQPRLDQNPALLLVLLLGLYLVGQMTTEQAVALGALAQLAITIRTGRP